MRARYRDWALRSASLGIAGHSAPALAPVVSEFSDLFGLRRRLRGPGVALTFDDGPHRQGTPEVMAVLAQHDVHATFFCIGEQVERQPNLVHEIVAGGHAVAVHGYRHRCHLRLTPRAVADDLARALDVIACAAGDVVPFHRPPYGVYTTSSLIQMRRTSLTPMLWSHWGRDWSRRATPRSIARRAGQGVGAGDVILPMTPTTTDPWAAGEPRSGHCPR